MIVCRTCGRSNEDGSDFCADCGRYLAWVGEYVPPEPEVVVEEEPEEEAPPPRLGFFRRVGIRLRLVHPPTPATGQGEAAQPDDGVREPSVSTAETRGGGDESGADEGDEEDESFGEDGEGGRPPDTIAVPAVGGTYEDLAAHVPDLVGLVGGVQAVSARSAEVAAPDTSGALALSPGDVVTSPGVSSRPTPSLRRPTEIDAARQARQRRRTNVVSLPTSPEGPRPGDVFCARCRQFNAPTRHFCRRCGAELAAGTEDESLEYQHLNFWHRHVRRDVRITNAGARPGRWGKASSGGGSSNTKMRLMGRIGAVVIALFIVFSYLGPYSQTMRSWMDSAYHSVVKKVDVTYTQQFAIGANASTSYPNHAAGLAVDDADNTYWQSLPSKKENGIGQYITILFAQPTTIDRIGILSGAGPSEQAFLSEARPREIRITIGRNGASYTEMLQDTNSFQHLDLHAAHVTSLTFKVLSVYPSATGHAVAITEIEFFQRT